MPRDTQQIIQSAFIRILNQKPLDKITVRDVVSECNVSRNTFYYYYQDIYALLEQVLLDETEQALQVDFTDSSWPEGVIASAHFALQNRRAVYHIFQSDGRRFLEKYLNRVVGEVLDRYIRHQAVGLTPDEKDIRLVSMFYRKALIGMMMDWMAHGMKEDPEQIIRRLGQLLDGNIRRILLAAENNKMV